MVVRAIRKKRVKSKRRLSGLALFALCYLAALFLLGFFGDRGFIRGFQLLREKRFVENNILRLKEENRRLEQMLKEFASNPRIAERKAREDLGLVRANELVYLFVSEEKR